MSSSPIRSPDGKVKGGGERYASPPDKARKIEVPEGNQEAYAVAMGKLVVAATKFDRDRNGALLATMQSRELDKELFRLSLRTGMNCRLSAEEMDLLLPHFENKGMVDGCEFILFFYRIRFEYKDKLLKERIAKEKLSRQKEEEFSQKRQAEIEAKSSNFRVSFDFTPEHEKSAMIKVTEAAFRYDRLMPGTVQLDAFECEYMTPKQFNEQLRRVFNIHLSPPELGSFIKSMVREGEEVINCATFLVQFLRLGFNERSRRMNAVWAEKARINEERERKRLEDLAELETKNALKCSFEFLPEDKERALQKLREAARLYDKAAPGAMSMQSFEVLSMPPHIFKEQLKRVFNLKVTPSELGALMSIFDAENSGEVPCNYFAKNFLAMGISERDRELKLNLEKQRKADEMRRIEQELKAKELANKNALQVASQFTEEEALQAMLKMTEAAFYFDKTMPGAPSLTAFESLEMDPVVFKEQLRRAFNMKLSPPELAALMCFFDPKGTGKIVCQEFLMKFLKLGFEERNRKAAEWRIMQKEAHEAMIKEETEKKLHADRKIELKVGGFKEKDFQSAMAKLTHAAIKFQKAEASVGLNAFDAESMPAHVFKEQLKLVFNLKISMEELGALMSYFDKTNKGVVNCKDFLNHFCKIGYTERALIREGWRIEQKLKKERDERYWEDKEAAKRLKSLSEVDFEFTEQDFDMALQKYVHMCFNFETRQLGPAGLSGFNSAFLTPSQFREMAKRTFGLKLAPRELGALVTYFQGEVPVKGEIERVVSCPTFLNSFVQVRVNCEEFKGVKDELKKLQEYQLSLKEAYKFKAARQGGGDASKPWRSNVVMRRAVNSAGGASAERRAYPKTPQEKIKLRLTTGKATGRMDLAAKAKWPIETSSAGEVSMRPASPPKNKSKGQRRKGALADKTTKALRDSHAEQLALATTGKAMADFKLLEIPEELFRMVRLTQLWLCNNMLGSIPSQIAELKALQVLSLTGNNLDTIPPEVCLLGQLRHLYLRRNNLTDLPDLFSRLRDLQELDLVQNKFDEFPLVLTSMPNLITLKLSKNLLTAIPQELVKMRSLSYLELEGNPIKRAPTVLGKCVWMDVQGCLIPNAERAANRFKLTDEDEAEIEGFLRGRAAARKAGTRSKKATRSKSPKHTLA